MYAGIEYMGETRRLCNIKVISTDGGFHPPFKTGGVFADSCAYASEVSEPSEVFMIASAITSAICLT